MCSRDPNDLDPELRRRAQCAIRDYKAQYPAEPVPVITCTARTNEQQAVAYAQGRDMPGKIITHAKPGESPHNQAPSAAFDIGFRTLAGPFEWERPELFERFAAIADRYGIKWGGAWRDHDAFHFQVPGWQIIEGVAVHAPWPEMPTEGTWPNS